MSSSPRTALVIGGGVCGLSIASELLARGVTPTIVSMPESGSLPASRRSFAWLNAMHTDDEPYRALRKASLAYMRGRADADPEMGAISRFPGTLFFTLEGEGGKVRSPYDIVRESGQEHTWLTPAETRAIEPTLVTDRLAGSFVAPGEGSIELELFVDLLESRLRRRGVRFVSKHIVPGILADWDPERGSIDLGDGVRVDADSVVVAAGAESARFMHAVGLSMGNGSNPGVIVRSRPVPRAPIHVVSGGGTAVRLHRGTGGILIHSSAGDGLVRWDDTGRAVLPPDICDQIIDEAIRWFDFGARPRPQEVVAGWRPITEDGKPAVGMLVEGVYSMHMHSGASNAAFLAEVLADEIVGARHPQADLAAPYRPERFMTGARA